MLLIKIYCRFRSLQVVSCSLQVVSGRFESFFARCRSFQVVPRFSKYAMQAHCIISLKVKRIYLIKAYILLFSCSVTRAVHLEFVLNVTTYKFIKTFKKSISRRKNQNTIYSDNAKTLKAEAKWLNSINRDVKFIDFFVRKRLSGISTFQGHHGEKNSTNVYKQSIVWINLLVRLC